MGTSGPGTNKVCLITGVGPGTGRALVERFSAGGYTVAMLARNAERLDEISAADENTHPYPCDVTDTEALAATIATIKEAHGAPTTVLHNAVGGAFGSFDTIDPAVLQNNFNVNTMALLHLARLVVDDMLAAGGGTILATGNTSAYRGKGNFAGFAPSKAAQRILIESIARSHGPQGIHAVFVAIDAVIDLPWTRKMNPDAPDDFFCRPADIADECFHVAHQARSTWSNELVIRPFGENW